MVIPYSFSISVSLEMTLRIFRRIHWFHELPKEITLPPGFKWCHFCHVIGFRALIRCSISFNPHGEVITSSACPYVTPRMYLTSFVPSASTSCNDRQQYERKSPFVSITNSQENKLQSCFFYHRSTDYDRLNASLFPDWYRPAHIINSAKHDFSVLFHHPATRGLFRPPWKTCHRMYGITTGNNSRFTCCIQQHVLSIHTGVPRGSYHLHTGISLHRQTQSCWYCILIRYLQLPLTANCNITFSGLSTMCTLCNNDTKISSSGTA